MKILVIKTSSLGDIIHAFSALEYLKENNKEAEIHWVVEKPYAELLYSHPLVDHVIVVDTRQWRKAAGKISTWQEILAVRWALQKNEYDVVFDLQGNTKSGLLMGLAKARNKVGFSKKNVAEWPNLLFSNKKFSAPPHRNIRQDYLALVQQYYNDPAPFTPPNILLSITACQQQEIHELLETPCLKKGTRLLISFGSIWRNKQISIDALIGFLELLQKRRKCSFLFIWGSEEERVTAEQLQKRFPSSSLAVEKMPLPVLQHLMAAVEMVLSMDSLPLHLAAAAGVPTFSLFGASSGAKYKPEGDMHISVQGACPYNKVFEKRCPVLRTCSTGDCIKKITPLQMYQALVNSSLDIFVR